MHNYATTPPLQFSNLKTAINEVYRYDVNQYLRLKKYEGQYAYLSYLQNIQQVVDSVFYKRLHGKKKSLSATIDSLSGVRGPDTCIVLNNTSLLGHVTVLRSLSNLLKKYARNGNVKVVCMTSPSKKQEKIWRRSLTEANLQVLELSKVSLFDRFMEIELLLKPRQYIWWGWPPGQWIGPLLAKTADHRSVSFKYDFPASMHFQSHHIGYGDEYSSYIMDECKIYGFMQPFSLNMIPSLTIKECLSFTAETEINYESHPLHKRERINIATLGRNEKIAQLPYLRLIKRLLQKDPRLVFHWTGRNHDNRVVKFFDDHNLSNRNIFHGYVTPFNYLSKIDIYLDTFPYGTGETFVTAGFMGLPIIAMNSPYEANFTNLIKSRFLRDRIIAHSEDHYCQHVERLLDGSYIHKPTQSSQEFRDTFDPAYSLTLEALTAKFANELEL